MKVIIAGSRDIELSYSDLDQIVFDSEFEVTHVISGMARGVDMCGYKWSKLRAIPVTQFPADWDTFGKSAGYKRNRQMSLNADALIAVMHPGGSKGTQHMIDIARAKGLKIFVKEWK